MAWKKGESGNPAGKAQGTRHKATTMLLSLMEQNAESITKTVIESARAGDLTAARMVLDRLVPHAKERPILLALPDTSTAEGVSHAQQAILQAVASGEITPGEGSILTSITENHRRSIATYELEARITALEVQHAAT